jgi:GNAT superfamily N-acetyltransferase
VRRADRHTMAVQSWLASRSPRAARFEGVGVSASSTGLPVSLLNLALGCRFPPDAPETIVDEEIERVKRFFGRRGVPWYWWLGPLPRPSNASRLLERHGLRFDRPPLPAMAAPLPARDVPTDSSIRVWLARSRADLETASVIRGRAFRFPPGVADHYFEDMADDWLRGDPARLYLAGLDGGPPASLVALVTGDGLPGVYVMATLPEFQRRGLGKAVLARLLADAAAEGHTLVVLTASHFGYPLYRQFGFVHLFDYEIYRPDADGA